MAPKSEKRGAAHGRARCEARASPASAEAALLLTRCPPPAPPTGRSGGGVRFCARFKVFKRVGAFFCNPALLSGSSRSHCADYWHRPFP
jgi:hypothetical protein